MAISFELWCRSNLRIVLFAGFAVAGAACTPLPVTVGPAPQIRVIDGDTFRLGAETIRLHGIDAPELRQACVDGWPAGAAARRALAESLATGQPDCERLTTDAYRRTVARCRLRGEDIAATLVRKGLAWAYTKYSVRYLPEERLAKRERAGIHGRGCDRPDDWRSRNSG